MRIDVLTLFPDMFQGVLGSSILRRASEPVPDPADPDNPEKVRPPVVSYHTTDIRTFTHDKHGKVDKPPYGGGPGMVLQCQPIYDAVMHVEQAGRAALDIEKSNPTPRRIVMTPKGEPLTQALAADLSQQPWLIIIAGHYEGFDQRVLDELQPQEISIGDYVLSGGELPAMVLIDTVVRLLPGALGDDASAQTESFSTTLEGMLDYPHYTRPPEWRGRDVPPVLLSGNHAEIEKWRREQAKKTTQHKRPDLLKD